MSKLRASSPANEALINEAVRKMDASAERQGVASVRSPEQL